VYLSTPPRTYLSTYIPIYLYIYLSIDSSIYAPNHVPIYPSIYKLSRYSDSLRAGRSVDPIPVGARFSAHVQTGPGAYPAYCRMGTGSFPGVKRPGRGVDHPPTSSAEVKERVELYLYSTSGPSWPVIGRTSPLPYEE
jgi:hypothetical protein